MNGEREFGGGVPGDGVPADVKGWAAPRGDVAVGRVFGEAWVLSRSQLGPFFLLGLVFLVVNGLLGSTGFGALLYGPLVAGLYFAVHRAANLGAFDMGDLFKGFSVFVPALLASLLVGIFASVGFVACVVPGLVVLMMYKMAYLFVLDRKMDFWQAMEASRKLYFANVWGLTLLYVAEACVLFLAALLCYFPLCFAVPLTTAMTLIAYRDLVGFRETGDYEPEAP
jgi:uncharacterized membrane protein